MIIKKTIRYYIATLILFIGYICQAQINCSTMSGSDYCFHDVQSKTWYKKVYKYNQNGNNEYEPIVTLQRIKLEKNLFNYSWITKNPFKGPNSHDQIPMFDQDDIMNKLCKGEIIRTDDYEEKGLMTVPKWYFYFTQDSWYHTAQLKGNTVVMQTVNTGNTGGAQNTTLWINILVLVWIVIGTWFSYWMGWKISFGSYMLELHGDTFPSKERNGRTFIHLFFLYAIFGGLYFYTHNSAWITCAIVWTIRWFITYHAENVWEKICLQIWLLRKKTV